MKNIFLIICFTTYLSGFSQTDSTLTQAEKNQQKVAELRKKLDGISNPEEVDASNTLIPRLVRIEEDIDRLLVEMELLKNSQQKSDSTTVISNDLLLQILTRLDQLSGSPRLEAKLNVEKGVYSKAHTSSNKEGSYYVVLESQRTKKQAERAVTMLSNKNEVKIVKAKNRNWYYIILPNSSDYANTLQLINKKRTEGFPTAWWVNSEEIVE